MKIGDSIAVISPFNGFQCTVRGTLTNFYGKDRVLLKTASGRVWALKKSEVKVIEN